MDTQEQEKMREIENQFEINKKYGGLLLLYKEEAEFLLQLVRRQDELLTSHAPEGHNYTNKQYVALLQKNEQLKTQLTEYERVVNAAQYWCETRKGGKWALEGGSKDLVNMLKVREAREQALINAVNDITKA